MNDKIDNILQVLNVLLLDKEDANEFVINELSFANKSSLLARNFAKSSGLILKNQLPELELDSPNFIFSQLLSSFGSFNTSIEVRLKIIDEIMKIHHVGKYENIKEREEIKNYCIKREIDHLVHFTRIENLRSILDIGLNSKLYNTEIQKKYAINDCKRFDYRTHMISLSISYPNDKMFYKYRMIDKNQKWAVIRICPSVLWELNCLFCPTNAANTSVSSMTDEALSGISALSKMFNKQSPTLRVCDPADSQAEVLVSNHIPKKYIKSVCFNEKNDVPTSINSDVIISPFYFKNRQLALRNYHSFF